MQKSSGLPSAGVVFLLVLVFATAVSSAKPYQETYTKRGWHLFLHPVKSSPSEQMAYCRTQLEQGRTKRAMKQFKALTIYWPGAPEAPTAQYEYARLLQQRENYFKAFDEYEYLVDHYTGFFPYDDVLEQQFQIAVHLMTAKKGRFLFFPGFAAPERAIPLFEKIIQNGPEWAKAAEAQYLIGKAYELGADYDLAVAAYMAAEYRYPESEFAEASAIGRTYSLFMLTKTNPNDDAAKEEAWAAAINFRARYPGSEAASQVKEYQDILYSLRAKAAYDKGYYYDRIAKKPKAAAIEYEALVRLFPNSEWTQQAQDRLKALNQGMETPHEDTAKD